MRLLICLVECARASGRCKGEVFRRTRPSAAMCMQKPRQCNRCSRHTRARGGEAGPAGGQWCSARTSSARSLRMRRARNRLSVTFVASQSAGMLVGGGFLVFRRRRVCAGFSAICRRKWNSTDKYRKWKSTFLRFLNITDFVNEFAVDIKNL